MDVRRHGDFLRWVTQCNASPSPWVPADHRGRGHARRILSALAGWAKRQGAEGACPPVEADNAGGKALYDGFGLKRELCRYHYRRGRIWGDLHALERLWRRIAFSGLQRPKNGHISMTTFSR
jgi:GNAT superfamily N-acetyltransferase